MTRKELERLVQGLADGALGGDEFAALQRELRENPAARAFYRESMEIELLLERALGPIPQARSGWMEDFLQRRRRKSLSRALMAAAAVVVLSAAMLHRFFVEAPETRILVSFTPGSSWSGPANGGELETGESMKVHFGLVEVKLPNGVRGVVEGPAEFQVETPGRLILTEGRAWFRVEKEARGFQVVTSRIRVTDLGTEFGVISQDDELDEVHVFDGRVSVAARFALRETRELAGGHAAQVSPVGRWIEREPNRQGFFTKLPPSLPGIRFSFDGNHPLQPEGVHPAVKGMSVKRIGGGQPQLIDGIRGKALALRGFDDVIATDWPGIGGENPRTIACWIRRDADTGAYAGIVSWGMGNGLQNGRCKLLVAKSPRNGHPVLRFSLGHSVHFSGSTPLEKGRWYHVAAVFRGLHGEGGGMVELYVDGQREKVDAEFSQSPKQDRKIGTIIDAERSLPLRIGTGPYLNATESFFGGIDEIYILPRALSEREVQGLMQK